MTIPHTPLATISPLTKRIRLARLIEDLRARTGLTQQQLAKRIGQARQAVTRLENPLNYLDRSLSADHVRAILLACGLSPEDSNHQAVMEIMWGAREEGWWSQGHPQMGERQRLIATAELGARRICEYSPHLLPGLVQTPEYARCRAEIFMADPDEVAGLVSGRLERQRVAFGNPDLTYNLVLEEMAILRQTAPREVLAAQLRHLLDLAQRPNVSVRILTLDAPLGPGQIPTSPCSIYSYPDPLDPEIAVIDTVLRDHFVIDPEGVRLNARLFERLRSAALSDAESAAFIRRVT